MTPRTPDGLAAHLLYHLSRQVHRLTTAEVLSEAGIEMTPDTLSHWASENGLAITRTDMGYYTVTRL